MVFWGGGFKDVMLVIVALILGEMIEFDEHINVQIVVERTADWLS